jgi:hypothetical protein
MALTVNTNIINDTDQYLLDAKNVRGGYIVVDSIDSNSLPAATTVEGSLCYCTTDSKFYQYDGSAWVVKEFGTTTAASQTAAGLMSKEDKTKLDGISTGAGANVQADWDVNETTSDAFIKNKPPIPTKSSWNYDDSYVKYSASQSLSDVQKTQARANIGAGTSNFSGDYKDLTNTPPTGAAAEKDVDTSISADSTSTNLPTSKAVADLVASARLTDDQGNKVDLSKYALKAQKIIAGNGLTGGGDLSTDTTLNVGAGNGIIVSGDTVSAKAGNDGITVDSTGINHAVPTTVAPNITAASRKYITGVTLDTYGHVTGLTTGTETTTDTHYTSKNIIGASSTATSNATATNGNVYLNHLENSNITSTHKIVGSGATVVTSDASGNITIKSAYSTTLPTMDGIAATGSSNTIARGDHKHPTDTSRAAAADLSSLTARVNSLISHGHDDPDNTTTSTYYFKY